jgi:hypothetical protein
MVGCRIRPLYGVESGGPQFCAEHKKPGMTNRATCKWMPDSANCANADCKDRPANTRFRGYCVACYKTLFPDDPLTFQTMYRSKQQATYQFVISRFDGFLHDSPMYFGGMRIDCRIVIGDTLLCIVTSQTIVITPTIFTEPNSTIPQKIIIIAFNPDKYIDSDGRSVNPMLYMRLPLLEDEIAHQMERIIARKNTNPVEVARLFTSVSPLTNSPE